MPPQITRLVLLTVILLGSYGVLRSILRPASFGEYGHYRGEALKELATNKPVYAGMKACKECHDELFPVIAKTPHKTVSCESCHGALAAHAKDPEQKPVKHTETLCLRCHAANPARPAFQKQVVRADHNPESTCVECHLPHQPNQAPK